MSPGTPRELAAGEPGAPTVVFAHGLEDSWASWRGLAAALDPRWRSVALDLPWRAGNDYGWRGRRPAEWLGDALDALGRPPDLLVAHSFGANAALDLLCARDPRAGTATALLCPFYRRPAQSVTWSVFDRSRASYAANIGAGVRARLGRRAAGLDGDVLATMVDLAVERTGPSGFLAVFEQFVGSGSLPLHRIDRPTLVVVGGADPVLSRRAAAELTAAIPGVRAHIEPSYDHYCHIRRAPGLAERIAAFVAERAPSTAAPSPGGPR